MLWVPRGNDLFIFINLCYGKSPSIDVGVPAFWLVFHSFFRTSHEPCLSGAKIGSAHLPSGTAPQLCNIASSPHLTVAKSSRKGAHSQLTSHNFIIFYKVIVGPSLSLPQKAPQLVSLTYWQSNDFLQVNTLQREGAFAAVYGRYMSTCLEIDSTIHIWSPRP